MLVSDILEKMKVYETVTNIVVVGTEASDNRTYTDNARTKKGCKRRFEIGKLLRP